MTEPIQYAFTTDYLTSEGSPGEALRKIAGAGWQWVHWCHHWHDDFCYGPAELHQVDSWLRELGLRIHDIHGSNGREKAWDSCCEYERQAGVELVRNRLEMAARFGCQVVIMHPARDEAAGGCHAARLESLRHSLTDLLPDLARLQVRIALENMADPDTFDQLDALMAEFPPDRVGICYDPGHGCIAGNGLDRLERIAHRLIALHLNDNDGREDLHQPLFMGKVDWPRLAGIVRRSGYSRQAMSVEVTIKHSGTQDEQAFLQHAVRSAERFTQLLQAAPGL